MAFGGDIHTVADGRIPDYKYSCLTFYRIHVEAGIPADSGPIQYTTDDYRPVFCENLRINDLAGQVRDA